MEKDKGDYCPLQNLTLQLYFRAKRSMVKVSRLNNEKTAAVLHHKNAVSNVRNSIERSDQNNQIKSG